MTDHEAPDDWRRRLTPEQYRVLREGGTERAFTGAYHDEQRAGLYRCAGCGAGLFQSADKYDSRSGWPSFTDAVGGAVHLRDDRTHGMVRIEAVCVACGGHLGHLFDDGPREAGGLRYCINSAALALDPADEGSGSPDA
ncbi:peptide-methionine (R)-S-oxide reductase MsrB [Rubrivirga sp. IMCC45206]|uniref:peptide-methionine (R)-S-oxide reductase MsrB n=1 Tax=Rubrivirga sp. IMCC45206 TaxID=3391614 RepID=UPI00399027A8